MAFGRRDRVNQDRRDASYERSRQQLALEWLTKAAEEEGARARVAIEYHAKLETVYFFARAAARLAAAVILERGQ